MPFTSKIRGYWQDVVSWMRLQHDSSLWEAGWPRRRKDRSGVDVMVMVGKKVDKLGKQE